MRQHLSDRWASAHHFHSHRMLKDDRNSRWVYGIGKSIFSIYIYRERFTPLYGESRPVTLNPLVEHRREGMQDGIKGIEMKIELEAYGWRSSQFVAPTQKSLRFRPSLL
jgi:hypothetical protein